MLRPHSRHPAEFTVRLRTMCSVQRAPEVCGVAWVVILMRMCLMDQEEIRTDGPPAYYAHGGCYVSLAPRLHRN